jgi:tetratricopeptide (TPR) repeat protein
VLFYVGLSAVLLLVPLNLSLANFHRSAFAKVQDHVGAFDYLKLQAQVIVHYLRLSFWPDTLLIDYSGRWGKHPTLGKVIPQAAVILLLLAATIVLVARKRPAGYLGLWFFAILAPTSSFLPLPTEIAAERRMYLPLMAVVALVVVGGYAVVRRRNNQATRVAAVRGLSLVVAAEILRTLQRNDEFKDPVGLWADVLVRQPMNRRAYANLGRELLFRNEDAAAAEVYRKILEIDPSDPSAWNNLAVISLNRGDWAEAERCARGALAVNGDYAAAHQNLARVYLNTGRFEESEREAREAIRTGGDRADRSALLSQIADARKNRPGATSLPASSSPSPPRP